MSRLSSGKQPRAVVTGGAGFIGSHVADRLLGLGYEVLVVDNLASGSSSNVPSSAPFEECDVADPGMVPLLERWHGEVIVHCAAQVSVASSVRDPGLDARSNIVGTAKTVQAAAVSGCRRFVYITTGGALYGEPQYLPCDEAHPIVPLSPYGLSKWAAERYLDLLAPDSMLRMVLRLANVYGPRQRSDGEGGVVSIFGERMKSGLPVEINGDGQQTRDFVYVRDVVDAVVAALSATHSVTANIATGRSISVLELYAAMSAISGYSKPPIFVAPRAGDVRDSRLAVGKALRELSWSPRTQLEEGLGETYASLSLT
jgi:UDP-glucose 4-epimerase